MKDVSAAHYQIELGSMSLSVACEEHSHAKSSCTELATFLKNFFNLGSPSKASSIKILGSAARLLFYTKQLHGLGRRAWVPQTLAG